MSLWPQKALLKETALHVEKDCLECEPKSLKSRWRLVLAVISYIRACLPTKALMKKAGLLRSLSSVTLNVDNEPPPFLDVDPKSLGDMARERSMKVWPESQVSEDQIIVISLTLKLTVLRKFFKDIICLLQRPATNLGKLIKPLNIIPKSLCMTEKHQQY